MMDTAEWIQTGAAATTLVLAGITWWMARATKDMASATRMMADTSDAQLDLLRRQTMAAETATEQNERRLNAETFPRLNILRAGGTDAAAYLSDDHQWGVVLKNDGPVPATVTEARINLTPQRIFLEPLAGGAIQPGGQETFAAEVGPQVAAQMADGSLPLPLSIVYSGPRGNLQNMQATLRGRENGQAWVVMEAEKHKVSK